MTDRIDYYLSLQSPWTWLGHDRLYAMAQHHGIGIDCRPVDFGAIFAQSGGLPLPKRAPQRQAYRLVELERWRKAAGVELNMHPAHFPAAEALAAHVVTALGLQDEDTGNKAGELAGRILKAVWVDEQDIGDDATLRGIISAAGHDAAALLEASGQAATDAAFRQNTDRAIEAGVFGAPTYLYKGELFWGQDRLDFLEQAMTA